MQNKIKIFVSVLLFGLGFSCEVMADGEFKVVCKPTENNGADLSTQFDLSHNNITLPRWGFENTASNKITFRGVLLDSDCVPISDAHIRMWQGGRVPLTGLGLAQVKLTGINSTANNYYTGGETYSDNKGDFNFIMMPNSICAHPSGNYMNVAISHPHFKTIETKIVIKNCSGNGTHTMVLVMDGKNKYRRY